MLACCTTHACLHSLLKRVRLKRPFSSDHFVNAGFDLSIRISFLFTAIIYHGSVLRDFVTSTVIPIHKKINCDMSDSENFRGISLSSLFGNIFDNVI